jgi:hypothetical protein
MDRRRFMGTAAGFAAGMVIAPRMGAAAEGVIDWYTGSDSNVLDFWANTVKPAFEAANPGITINLVDAGDNAGLQAIGERAMAAMQTNTDPQADYFENFDPRLPAGAIEAGIYVNMKEAGLSNYAKVNPLAFETNLQPALSRQPGAAGLRHVQAVAGGRADDMGGTGRLDQGQSRPVHLQPPRQGRLGRQLRAPRDPRGERPRPVGCSRSTNFDAAKAEEMLAGGFGASRRIIAPTLYRRRRLCLGQRELDPASGAGRGHDDPGVVGPWRSRRSTRASCPRPPASCS